MSAFTASRSLAHACDRNLSVLREARDGARDLMTAFASLKKELAHHEDYATREQARASIFEYIEAFSNRVRTHSALGYVAPAEYERTHNPTHR